MNKRTIEYLVVGFFMGLVLFSILYYYLNYNSMNTYQKINYGQEKLLLLMSVIFSVFLILHPIMRWIKRKKFGKLIVDFNYKTSKWKYVLFIYLILVFLFLFNIFLLYPGFIILSLLVVMSFMIVVIITPEIFEKGGLTSKGIIYKGKFFLWSNVKSYSWQSGNRLILKFVSVKILFIEYNPRLEIHILKSYHEKIEEVLKNKITS